MNGCTYSREKVPSYRPSGAHSPECVEGVFYELRELKVSEVLGFLPRPRRTLCPSPRRAEDGVAHHKSMGQYN
jgi:hypothetical protein